MVVYKARGSRVNSVLHVKHKAHVILICDLLALALVSQSDLWTTITWIWMVQFQEF